LNFLDLKPQLDKPICTEIGASELGNSVPPGSAQTLEYAPDQQLINLQSIDFNLFWDHIVAILPKESKR
jgi:hypothetical protein